MDSATMELMHEQVRTIYRAATGDELPAPERSPATETPLDSVEVERRFAELVVLVRLNPAIGERVPPFSFTPLVDVIDDGPELVVEVAAPDVETADIEVAASAHELRVSGIRHGRVSNGRAFLHAEIPCGPFSRTLQLPHPIDPQPAQVEARNGVIVIRLRKL
jgi:HSP20 family molecular chaperone IbpA